MGKYVAELLAHFDGTTADWHFFGDRPEAPFHRPSGVAGKVDLFEVKGHRFHAWEQGGLPWRAWRAGVALLHCTASTLPLWQPVPTVVTLHDTLPWRDVPPDPYQRGYWRRLLPAALRRCAAVITISQASRRDILALWPDLEPKLWVIPHGVGDAYVQADDLPPPPWVGAGPYLLYLGGVEPRKRFAWALEVFRRVPCPHLRLLVCGFGAAERVALEPALAERVCFLPFVAESEMPGLYRHAAAVLYPSLYEGFGLPVVEAQAVGAPILFSPLGSLAELNGPGTVILPADDLDAWVTSCQRLVAERGARPRPDPAARAWAGQFSWAASARQHWQIYTGATYRHPRRLGDSAL